MDKHSKKHSATNPPQHCANGKLQWQGLMPLHRMKQRSLRLKSKRREGDTSFAGAKACRAIGMCMLNAGSRLGLRFFCLFPPVTDAAIVRTPRLKSTGKDTLFMAPQILTFIIVLAVIFIIFKIFNLSIKIFSNCLSMHLLVQHCCLFLTLFCRFAESKLLLY